MGRFLCLAAFVLVAAGTACGGGFLSLAGEVKIPLPDNWHLTPTTTDYPFQIFRNDSLAELLIFKSDIDPVDAICSQAELHGSVDKVIEDVILTLPEARLQTNVGYYDTTRVWFTLEFVSLDPSEESQLQHRLKGVLYRHPDGHQILFTLWGKAPAGVPPTVMEEISLMQDGFAYSGDMLSNVFAAPVRGDWAWLAILLVTLGIVLLLLRRRRQLVSRQHVESISFWRCQCGRLNHNDHRTCHRCGRPVGTPVTP